MSAFLQPPLLQPIGGLADKAAVEAIFDGTFVCPPEVDYWTAKFITQLERNPATATVPTVPIYISARSHSAAWKKQRANTASEGTTLGFPHYIV